MKKNQIVDFIIFIIIFGAAIVLLQNEKVSSKVDSFFLPEERNKGYYEILNNGKKCYVSDELLENGTKNLLANYLKSGERNDGYSIQVNSDGTFSFSGRYNGENNKNEAILPIGVGFGLDTGDYIFSDGGASTSDGIKLKLTGVKHMIGGETSYITVAELPEEGMFHWDNDPNIELYVEIVIRPEVSAKDLTFCPMLIKTTDAVGKTESDNQGSLESEYMPCLALNYVCENENRDSFSNVYNFSKGSLDSGIVTKDDWRLFLNEIKYQMQADRAVIDLQDGTGIEILKKDFPAASYGQINASKIVCEEQKITITDFQEVLECIKTSRSDLKYIRDCCEYLKLISHENYTVFLSVMDDGVSALNHGTLSLLQKLGVTSGLMDSENDNIKKKKYSQNSFLCVLRGGHAEVEILSEQKLTSEGKLSDGSDYIIESCGKITEEPKASIRINGVEYAMNKRGMNIVVYDEETHEVVDSVCFDTCYGLQCHRQSDIN